MAPFVSFFLCAVPDLTLSAVHKPFLRQAPPAPNVFDGQGFAVGEGALAGSASLVKIEQPFFQFGVIVPGGKVDGTDTTIKAAGRKEMGIDRHFFLLSSIFSRALILVPHWQALCFFFACIAEALKTEAIFSLSGLIAEALKTEAIFSLSGLNNGKISVIG